MNVGSPSHLTTWVADAKQGEEYEVEKVGGLGTGRDWRPFEPVGRFSFSGPRKALEGFELW